MVRKRGGTTGQGQGQGQGRGGGKRTATSPPVGATYKDSRRNIQGDEEFDDEEEPWTQVNHNKPKSPSKHPSVKETRYENEKSETFPPVASIIEKLNKQSSERGSVTGVAVRRKGGSVIDMLNERASVRGSVNGSIHGHTQNQDQTKRRPDSLYKTAPPEGCMRDVLSVAVLSRNDEDYRGTVTYNEAKYEMFMKGMDLPEDLLHGIKIQFGKGPTVSFKLTEQIDVDTLSEVEFFEFERVVLSNGVERRETFKCRLKGVRQRRPAEDDSGRGPNIEEERNVFNVRVIGCDYSVEEEEILEWLNMYGETFGRPHENFYYDPNPTAKPTGDGTYTIKMRIDRQIPQFLPMYGKKIRVEHRAIQILCTNCYGKHHRKVCKSEKVAWMDYVEEFMNKNPDVTNIMIGRWYDIAKEEGRVPKAAPKPNEERRRPSDEIAFGTSDMQDAIEKVRQLSNKKRAETTQAGINHPQGQHSNPTEFKRRDKNDPEVLKHSIWLRTMSAEEGERLYELTELGLSMDAARELREQEKTIEEVHKMLDEKRKKIREGTRQTKTKEHE